MGSTLGAVSFQIIELSSAVGVASSLDESAGHNRRADCPDPAFPLAPSDSSAGRHWKAGQVLKESLGDWACGYAVTRIPSKLQ